jgi:Transposase zinc-binding domain
MGRFGLEVADVFRRYGEAFRQCHGASLSTAQRRAMTAIELCRTAALGGHVEHCDHCDHQRISYNSCIMGKFRNGELTIDAVAKLTVFPVILSRSIHALLPITMADRRDPRSAGSCS